MKAVYLNLSDDDFKEKIKKAYSFLSECSLCPRNCGVNRLAGELGACKTASYPVISSFNSHFGEEDPLVGKNGSGTIFFANCNLQCIFCQNYDISQMSEGRNVSVKELAEMMLYLENVRHCHNINFVTPTHQMPFILEALYMAVKKGLSVPLVYNCGGYEPLPALEILEGVIDIYMPDFKYGNNETAFRLSGIKNYFDIAKEALKEMHRQVGDLVVNEQGIAEKGLLIRHLVLPENLAHTENVLSFIAGEISLGSYVNIMDQYRPSYHAYQHPPLNRRLTHKEFNDALRIAASLNLDLSKNKLKA